MLILAAVSIATLTGENGILTKASNTGKESDVEDTKEQIKIELMGNKVKISDKIEPSYMYGMDKVEHHLNSQISKLDEPWKIKYEK